MAVIESKPWGSLDLRSRNLSYSHVLTSRDFTNGVSLGALAQTFLN